MQYRRMRRTRRTVLTWIAGLLVCGNLVIMVPAMVPEKREWVTHAGLDSMAYMIPLDRTASAYRDEHWKPGLDETRLAPDSIDYVTLAPGPTYGKFLHVIRDLKRRRRCNVLIHYPGIRILEPEAIGVERVFDVPALVLCGRAVGDAGIQEPVPTDGFITA
ncbi:hypothetical protein [Sphingomonas hankookensis]